MGLSDTLPRAAARHAHALVVEVPGWWRTRAAVERAVLGRGWRLALSPADADVLVVCGEPGPRLGDAVELVWQQMPGPRARVEVGEYDDVADRLDEAHAGLLDTGRHRHDAQHRPTASDLLAEQTEQHQHDQHDQHAEGHDAGRDEMGGGDGDEGMDHGGHEGMDHGGDEQMDHGGHEGMDHGGDEQMDHGGHEGMDHGDMDMSPGGIPLAEGGEDRDGLEMDVLTVRLGPVLPYWPAGLVLHCSLQGDVITTAHAETVDGPGRPDSDPAHEARSIDNIVSLLALAGWDDAAAEARRARDMVLELGMTGAIGARLDRLRRKVRRSRLLRWSLRGLRPLSDDDLHRHGLPSGATGDAYDRVLRMLDGAIGAPGGAASQSAQVYSTDHLAHLVTGLDLATARLVLAGLDIHQLRSDHAGHEVSHG